MIAAIVAIAVLSASLPMARAADTSATLALASFPDNRGNPYSSSSVTAMPYWSAVYDPLVLLTADGAVEPWLAMHWEPVGPTTWRIKLRPDVAFSNGEILTSAAVTAAIHYLKSARGAREPIARELADILEARAIDSFTVDLAIKSPDPLLPRKLSLLRLVAPETFDKIGPAGFPEMPAGTGPYHVVRNTPTASVMAASPRSWRHAPTNMLTALAAPEAVGRRNAVITGQADIAISAVSHDDLQDLDGTRARVFIDELPSVIAMTFNTVRSPLFRDVRVRKAITLAIDREAIVKLFIGADAAVANQPSRRGAFGHNAAIPTLPYDPGAARALLREAGYPNGFSFDMEMQGGTVVYSSVFQKVASDLAKIGVTMHIHLLPQQEFVTNVQTGNWKGQAFPLPFYTSSNDALYPMRQNSCLWHAPWYCDPVTTAMIEDAWQEGDLEARRTKTEAVMARAASEAQAAFLYESLQYILLGPRVTKFRSDFEFIRYELMEVSAPAQR